MGIDPRLSKSWVRLGPLAGVLAVLAYIGASALPLPERVRRLEVGRLVWPRGEGQPLGRHSRTKHEDPGEVPVLHDHVVLVRRSLPNV